MHATVEQGTFVPGHTRSVIRKEEHDGIFSQAILFQLLEEFPHLLIHCTHAVMEAGHGFTDDGGIGVVGGVLFFWDYEFDPSRASIGFHFEIFHKAKPWSGSGGRSSG